jgi:osmotically-inducible protein OsmY
MNSPLQANFTADQMAAPTLPQALAEHEYEEEEGHEHIHMPNPSLWPLIAGAAILVTMAGIIFIGTNPWVTIIGAPFILIGILGWAIEDPFAPRTGVKRSGKTPTTYAEADATGRPTVLAELVLQDAQDVADRVVTVRSTEWSAHPVKVEIEREGVVLALYGKVELEAQRKALEDQLLQLPGVIDVKNFLVAEDSILNAANAAIERLRAAGKLEGAKDIQVLVENYIISLYGETPTNAMKYALERELVGIPGVKVVVNHINLDEDIPGNLGKTKNR